MKFRQVSDLFPSLLALLTHRCIDAGEKVKTLQEERVRSKALQDDLAQTKESYVVASRRLEELSRENSQLEDHHNVTQSKLGGLETNFMEVDQRLREANKTVDALRSGNVPYFS